MKKIATILIAALALGGFSVANAEFGIPSFNGETFTMPSEFPPPALSEGETFYDTNKNTNADGTPYGFGITLETGAYFLGGIGMAGGFYQKVNNIGSSKMDYIFDIGVSSPLYTGDINGGIETLVDNIFSWNVLPKNNIARLNLGVNTRLGSTGLVFNLMPHINLDITPGLEDLHLRLVGNIGLIDFLNHDGKLSIAYDFGFLNSKVKPGIEFGGKFLLGSQLMRVAELRYTFGGVYIGLYITY